MSAVGDMARDLDDLGPSTACRLGEHLLCSGQLCRCEVPACGHGPHAPILEHGSGPGGTAGRQGACRNVEEER